MGRVQPLLSQLLYVTVGQTEQPLPAVPAGVGGPKDRQVISLADGKGWVEPGRLTDRCVKSERNRTACRPMAVVLVECLRTSDLVIQDRTLWDTFSGRKQDPPDNNNTVSRDTLL